MQDNQATPNTNEEHSHPSPQAAGAHTNNTRYYIRGNKISNLIYKLHHKGKCVSLSRSPECD